MSRSLGILGACALLLGTAGCTLDSLFLSIGSSSRREETVFLSLENVSASLHTMARSDFGINLVDSRDGEELHLKGQTQTGKKFEFILQRQKSEYGERTVIVFDGDKEAEGLLWDKSHITLQAILKSPPKQNTQETRDPKIVPDRPFGVMN